MPNASVTFLLVYNHKFMHQEVTNKKINDLRDGILALYLLCKLYVPIQTLNGNYSRKNNTSFLLPTDPDNNKLQY